MKLSAVLFLLLLTYLLLLIATYLLDVKVLVVTSNSMKPAFEFGDVLLAVSQEHYQPNDMISFTAKDDIVTHRILSVKTFEKTTEYQTKGDANASADLGLVSQTRVLGKVAVIVPKVGYIVLFLKSRFVAMGIIYATLFVTVLYPSIRKCKYAK